MEMLGFVGKTYVSILKSIHRFSQYFRRIVRDAQRFLVRMMNRRGAVFNRDQFRWAEIGDTHAVVKEMKGVCRHCVAYWIAFPAQNHDC
jgi:DNA polymerase-3 subunit epsilon